MATKIRYIRGIEVNPENAKNLVLYLADVIEFNNLEIVDGITHLGWINKDFIPYTSKYKYDRDLAYKNIFESVLEKGEYEKWKTEIRKLRSNSRTLRFLIASSFASPLIKIFQINPFIVHLWGKSSNGKTSRTNDLCKYIRKSTKRKIIIKFR